MKKTSVNQLASINISIPPIFHKNKIFVSPNTRKVSEIMFEKLPQLALPKSFISLLSTGLDSPVASYLIMKQGYSCLSLSFLNGGDERHKNKEKILKIGKKLVEITNQRMRMHFVDYDHIVEQFSEKCEPKLTCIICKRTMILTAVQLAEFYNASMIVNGDILGEQASQTLDNLYAVHQINKKIPVVRPLIGFDKLDVIKIQQQLGLYEISLIDGLACDNNPRFPETRARISKVLATEENIDRSSIQKHIFDIMEFVDLYPSSSI